MTRFTVCPAILAYRVHKVADQHKVPVVMYDYYDNCKLTVCREKVAGPSSFVFIARPRHGTIKIFHLGAFFCYQGALFFCFATF